MANILDSFTLSQSNRFLKIKTSLGEKALLLDSFEGQEIISCPFFFDLGLLSEQGNIELKELTGAAVDVSIQTANQTKRHFHGYVASFSHTGSDGGLSSYHAILVPWLHFLGLRTNCRVFQRLSVLDIVQAIFKDYGNLTDFTIEAEPGNYKPITLTIQYDESDLAFVSRMLEYHGLYYYFRFQEGRHTMVIADPTVIAKDMPGQASIAYNVEGGATKSDTIKSWGATRVVISTHYAVKSFDFKNPRDPLAANTQTDMNIGDQPKLEHYEHRGAFTYADYQEGQDFARRRMDQLELASKMFEGTSDVRTLTCGHIFELTGHSAVGSGDDRNFFVLRVGHRACNNYKSGGESSYENTFACTRKAIPVRSGQHFAKPVMPGPQTAIVVGPEGEDIYCDKYCRIKVQFHWDREGKYNEQSSCWVRVATQWAGHRFGVVSLPRVGTEVIVEFLEGDPDRPIVTGAVFNEINMPPWELPANKTQSGILTQSTKGGDVSTANALRFEDKKGAEEVWLHAEKDQRIEVENNETHDVGVDRTKTIGNNESSTIGANRTETVGANETISIGANRTEMVGANETITVAGRKVITIMQAKSESVLLASTEQVGLARNLMIGAAYTIEVGAAMNTMVVGVQGTQVMMSRTVSVSQDQITTIGGRHTENVAHTRTLTAGDCIELICGNSRLVMKKDGTITLKGKDIQVESTSDTKIKATGELVLKGSKIGEN